MVASHQQEEKLAALAEDSVNSDSVHHCPKEHLCSLNSLMP